MVTQLRPQTSPRRIVHRTRGRTHGPITRLASPGDLGEQIKPFVFLDLFEMTDPRFSSMPYHPHSGIATHTTMLAGSLAYADTTGKSGVLRPGGVEWMQAGGGVWHTGHPVDDGRVLGFQLWIALPPALELAPAYSAYVDAAAVPGEGAVRVLLGTYGHLKSPIPYDEPVTYLHVHLEDGERWTYQPADTHDVAWLAVASGRVRVAGTELERELAIFEDGAAPIELVARGAVDLVVASATKHAFPLVTGSYSVHTTREALAAGEAGYAAIAAG